MSASTDFLAPFDFGAPRVEIVLSEQQQVALDRILTWLEGPEQEFRLGGYAGTGKTTLIKEIRKRAKLYASVAAFTGKAVAVLRSKGVTASTLHALLYDVRRIGKKVTFIPKTVLPCDLVIVDEASMISTELYNDLRRHDVKLLFVGDPAQLEPVGDNPDLMKRCDYVLTEIHRQAEQSPILRAARAVREGNLELPLGRWSTDQSTLTITDSVKDVNLADFDIAICAKNLTRHGLNARRRAQLGHEGLLVVGERVICLKNDKNVGVFNGMMLSVNDIVTPSMLIGGEDAFELDMTDDAGDEYFDIGVSKKFFGKDFRHEYQPHRGRTAIAFDYGYALTGHKSQGSEWDNAVVYEETLYKIDKARWLYTAITRAAKNLTIVREGGRPSAPAPRQQREPAGNSPHGVY